MKQPRCTCDQQWTDPNCPARRAGYRVGPDMECSIPPKRLQMKISKKNWACAARLMTEWDLAAIASELQKRDDKIKALRAQVKQLKPPTCSRCHGTGRYELTTTGYGDVQITSTEECRQCP